MHGMAPARTGPRMVVLDCVAVFTLALLVRLAFIASHSLWVDEFFSIFWSRLDPAFLLGPGAQIETNPPAYYLFLHGWMGLFGDSAAAVRLPGALASAGSVVCVHGAMRMLFNRQAAWLAALLLCVNATSVFFAQQARAYPFVALADGLMLLALAGYARRLDDGRPRLAYVALFTVAAILSVLLHYTSLLTVAAGFGAVGALLLRRPIRWREATVWTGAGLIVAVAIIKPVLTAQSLAASPNIAWIDDLSPWLVRGFYEQMLAHPDIPLNARLAICAYVLGAVALAGLVKLRLNRAQFCAVVLPPVLFTILMLAASVSRPILLPRVAQWLELPVCMVLAACILAWRGLAMRLVLGTVCAACLLVSLWHYDAVYQTEDWRAAARIIATDARCSGPVVTTGPYGLGIVYYQPETARRPFYDMVTQDGGDRTSEHLLGAMTDHATDLDGDSLRALVARQPHVALLILPQQREAIEDGAADVLNAASAEMALPGGLSLLCY